MSNETVTLVSFVNGDDPADIVGVLSTYEAGWARANAAAEAVLAELSPGHTIERYDNIINIVTESGSTICWYEVDEYPVEKG